MSSRVNDALISAVFYVFPDQFIDCEHSFDANLVAGLVDGSKCPNRFLDPTKTEDYNTDLFLKQHLALATTFMNVHANFLRLCFEYFFIAIEKVDDCISDRKGL